MENIVPFNFEDHRVRVVVRDGEPWWIAKDVCDVLGIGNPSQAISRLDDDEHNTLIINDGIPGNPRQSIINESGLWSLVLTSRMPYAKKFKRWITSEVIPSIRKTGQYSIQPKSKALVLAEALVVAHEMIAEKDLELSAKSDEIELKDKILAKQAPKISVYEEFLNSQGAQSINTAAKLFKVGPLKLFEFLKTHGILMGNNVPYQIHMTAGRFKLKESSYRIGEKTVPYAKTLVTPKGLVFIYQRLIEEHVIEAAQTIGVLVMPQKRRITGRRKENQS